MCLCVFVFVYLCICDCAIGELALPQAGPRQAKSRPVRRWQAHQVLSHFHTFTFTLSHFHTFTFTLSHFQRVDYCVVDKLTRCSSSISAWSTNVIIWQSCCTIVWLVIITATTCQWSISVFSLPNSDRHHRRRSPPGVWESNTPGPASVYVPACRTEPGSSTFHQKWKRISNLDLIRNGNDAKNLK